MAGIAKASGSAWSDKEKLRIFISYTRDDLAFADQLNAALDAYGFECIIDRNDIVRGEDWKRRLGNLISEADTVVFVLSPSSASSAICEWEVEEATRLNKRILPIACRPIESVSPPPRLQDLNYIFFYAEPKIPGSGFGIGLARLTAALNTDFDWVREHTRYLQRAIEWDRGGRPANRLLSSNETLEARAWAAHRPPTAPEPTALHLEFIRASDDEAARLSEGRKQLEAIAVAQAEREAARKPNVSRKKRTAGGNIFISYRREDSRHFAGRLHDRLAKTFGKKNLLMDVDSIPPGVDFVAYLNDQVAACDAILVVIGSNWLNERDESGARRLDDPDDFVAIEIAAALARDIRVIPVLVDGAHMPKARELPDSLKAFARRNAVALSHTNFGSDADRLIKQLREALDRKPTQE